MDGLTGQETFWYCLQESKWGAISVNEEKVEGWKDHSFTSDVQVQAERCLPR